MREMFPKHILVVEDRLDYLEAAERYFKSMKNLNVDYMEDSSKALKALTEDDGYDMILMDANTELPSNPFPYNLVNAAERKGMLWVISKDMTTPQFVVNANTSYKTHTYFYWNLENKPYFIKSSKEDDKVWHEIFIYALQPPKNAKNLSILEKGIKIDDIVLGILKNMYSVLDHDIYRIFYKYLIRAYIEAEGNLEFPSLVRAFRKWRENYSGFVQ